MDDNAVIYDYVQTHSTNKTYLEFVVWVDKGDVKSDLENLLNFVDSMTINRSTTKAQVLNLPGITPSSKRGVSITKVLDQ